ncbi:urea transporter [Hymenobacter cheonanensis]|uniref:urea transporter n=1 Tax=Hymenobacter sp. CA2-7 TaxID=3063993 RepID=UPI002713B504|nr:urea transporter [Hymenobacter sp. CA2-7]MDO7884899.1 urea transporter [Hymenobacter sp. CA2-7]
MSSYLRAVLHSYSMLFFSQHRGLAVLLGLATLASPWAAAAGLAAASLAVAGARLGGFRRDYTDLGAYSFNALLVGLALPLYFAPAPALAGLVVVGAGLALLLSVALGGWLGGRGLPFLSLPFVLTMWLLLAAGRQLPLLPAEPSTLWLNTLYAAGGPRLVDGASWLHELSWPPPLATYLRALSAVLLQDSAWAGLLVAAGLLWHSRIAFSLSLLAFGGAWGLAHLLGTPDAYDLGANYIMAAVAVGAVFALPSAGSYGWAALSLPVTAVGLAGLTSWLRPAGGVGAALPVLSLPYCLTALLFLYVWLLRENLGKYLVITPVQRYSPEANLYAHLAGQDRRPADPTYVPLALPFLGEWRCTQGYADGGPTHQGPWGQALDFVVADPEGQTYQNEGLLLSDYYCYNKPVLAPADGVVEEVIEHLPDNPIGQVDTRQNWGNTVVLRHRAGLYTQLSHLRAHSVRVRPGQAVRRGEVLAACGSSGRSPEPHLHFQVQAAPAIGSPTLAYPLADFLVQKPASRRFPVKAAFPNSAFSLPHLLKTHAVPRAGEVVRSPVVQPQLARALHLPPGQVLEVRPAEAPPGTAGQRWEVFTDAYNARYLRCQATGAVAYFEQDGAVLQFTAYYGPRQAALYWLYLAAYRVPLLHLPQPEAVALPLSVGRRWGLSWLQDALAPFFRFVQPGFSLSWADGDPGPTARHLRLHSQAVVAYFGREHLVQQAELVIQDGQLAGLSGQRAGLAVSFTIKVAV